MILPAFRPLGAAISADDRNLLAASGLVDDPGYRQRADLPNDVDAVAHYLERGWRQGLEPRDGFDGEFLRPYYEAAGRAGPPALTWLELSVMPGRRAPVSRTEAELLASRIRTSPLFDAEAYATRLGASLDPAIHYVVVGELLGWPPSEKFDPAFYLERHIDVAEHFRSPLEHFIYAGQKEGRRPLPATARLQFPDPPDRRQRTVMVIVHEASRTGAPVVGWNIARRLSRSYQVVSVLMRGGELEKYFAAIRGATVGPLVWEEWHPTEMSRLAQRLVDTYHPWYAVADSIETHLLVPALARLGVPSVALVHEFAAYTRPLGRMRDVFDWATHVVFPAHVVAQSSYVSFPALARRRGIHVLPQGRVDVPMDSEITGERAAKNDGELVARVRPPNESDSFVVLGVGTVQVRKGVDLFLSTAAAARRLAPNLRFRFVWIGDGYDPAADVGYSAYVAEQIVRSDLADTVALLEATENLEPAFAKADMFFMCSRLDPQPNVGIEAMTRGLPTTCFAGACGTAEILASNAETQWLVVPYMDTHGAAQVICHLASHREDLAAVGDAVRRVATAACDMDAYVSQVDAWGREAEAALRAEDLKTLAEARVIDPELALPCGTLAPGALGLERHVLQQWAVVGTSLDQVSNPHFRRPCAGFHPQVYARAHADACVKDGANPLAHWLRAGRPGGPWSRQVFSPLDSSPPALTAVRAALHAHFHHTLNAPDLAMRLTRNAMSCDLFLSTDTDVKAGHLRSVFGEHRGTVDIRIVPNRGRDIGPFLTGLAAEITNGRYDVFGHVHGKQSHDQRMGNLWRDFLWENLVGGSYPTLDLVAAAFEHDQNLGLVMAEDPHLVGWDGNRAIGEALAGRMGLALPLDDFFDFPLGNMFWARPRAIQPLLDLRLGWSDYPPEPVAGDGTVLHALERLLPRVVQHAGFTVASVRVPETTW